jgi:hypothetical protein
LIEEIIGNQKKSMQEIIKKKDEHNVKRRVYDALNVLISAGLLKKEGKEVSCNLQDSSSN